MAAARLNTGPGCTEGAETRGSWSHVSFGPQVLDLGMYKSWMGEFMF